MMEGCGGRGQCCWPGVCHITAVFWGGKCISQSVPGQSVQHWVLGLCRTCKDACVGLLAVGSAHVLCCNGLREQSWPL